MKPDVRARYPISIAKRIFLRYVAKSRLAWLRLTAGPKGGWTTRARWGTAAGAVILTIALPIAIDQGYFRYNSHILPILGLLAVCLYAALFVTTTRFRLFFKQARVRSALTIFALLVAIGVGATFAIKFSKVHVAELKQKESPGRAGLAESRFAPQPSGSPRGEEGAGMTDKPKPTHEDRGRLSEHGPGTVPPAGFITFFGQVVNGMAPMVQVNQTAVPLDDVELEITESFPKDGNWDEPSALGWQTRMKIGTVRASLVKSLDESFPVQGDKYIRYDIFMLTRLQSYREVITMVRNEENRYEAELTFYRAAKPVYSEHTALAMVNDRPRQITLPSPPPSSEAPPDGSGVFGPVATKVRRARWNEGRVAFTIVSHSAETATQGLDLRAIEDIAPPVKLRISFRGEIKDAGVTPDLANLQIIVDADALEIGFDGHFRSGDVLHITVRGKELFAPTKAEWWGVD